MNLTLVVRGVAVLLAARLFAAEPSPSASDTAAIVVAPKRGELSVGEGGVNAIRVTFPTPMVEVDQIKRAGQPSPVLFDPVIETDWTWVSQTEGKLGVGGLLTRFCTGPDCGRI